MSEHISFTVDYFKNRRTRFVSYISCGSQATNTIYVKAFMESDVRISIISMTRPSISGDTLHTQWYLPLGVLIDGSCGNVDFIFEEASKGGLFDASHIWLIIENAGSYDNEYILTDIFNFGKIQGNKLERKYLGVWRNGLHFPPFQFKYYDRWDFHNLTLRAVTVILGEDKIFSEEIITSSHYTNGVSKFTKEPANLLKILRSVHNFSTKFFYLIPNKGIGSYENRFLSPLSPGAWWCTLAAAIACSTVLAASVSLERKPFSGLYAVLSIISIMSQQGYAYHTEPYNAYQYISRTFHDTENCQLGSLPMMPMVPTYVVVQKHSPYKEFFDWSLLRLKERGFTSVIRSRLAGVESRCSGSSPRALALGQAAPAFTVLLHGLLAAVLVLLLEIVSHR
ncbi:unnamed protein product [Leptidea sinapis]|uniref:Ionotropic receptor 75a N-terminal domain-containing protein n=1 Tax=Leptidea sinapis TaxID=189913 RepID=A0A5E4Q5R6_9NEOP|nr:unnamed protein product [Leptidea sinapis]